MLSQYCIVPGKCRWMLAAQAQKLRAIVHAEEVLEWINYLPIQDAKLAAGGYRARKMTDPYPHCRNVHRLQNTNVILQLSNAENEAMDGVCVKHCCQMLWCLKRIRMITWAQPTYFQFTAQEFSIVGGYMKDLKTPHKTVKFWGCVVAWGWLLTQDNTVILPLLP